MNNTAITTTTTREQELEVMKALMEIMFVAQDAWEEAGCIVGSDQHKAYKVAAIAYGAAQTAWINS